MRGQSPRLNEPIRDERSESTFEWTNRRFFLDVCLGCDWWTTTIKGVLFVRIHHSRVMSREGRWLTEQEFDEIVVVLREELEKRLKFLSDDRIVGNNRLPLKIFDLEFCIVSPLYYRLQRHLIDWGTWSHHPEFSDSKLVKWLDERGYKYDDIIPLQYHKT